MNSKDIFLAVKQLITAVSESEDLNIRDISEKTRALSVILKKDYCRLSEVLYSIFKRISNPEFKDTQEERKKITEVYSAAELILFGENEDTVLNGLDDMISESGDIASIKELLNQAALLLVQTDPGDKPGFKDILNVCNEAAPLISEEHPAFDSFAKASARIKTLSGRKKTGLNKIYGEAGLFLEQALQLIEEADLLWKPEPETVQKNVAERISEDNTLECEYLPDDTDMVLLEKCIAECFDLIERGEDALLKLEKDPNETEALNTVFRSFHTIKGSASFLGIPFVSELGHEAESLLHKVREKEISFTNNIADLALRSADTLKTLLTNVQRSISSNLPVTQPPEYGALLSHLTHHQSTDRKADLQSSEDTEPADTVLEEIEETVKTDTVTVSGTSRTESASIRIRTDRLDTLIDMVGELVIAQSMVSQDVDLNHTGNYSLLRKVIHTGKIVRELQDLTLSMRMIPLKSTFQKMSRLVRDLSYKSGKEVVFMTDGEDTEIDRNMVDYLNDPLVHILRNAVDHGIENAGERIKAGKTEAAHISLSAYSSGGNIVVEIKDDGKGLQKNRIIERAVINGLIESGKGLSDREIYNLIFEPGFSTSEQVTDLSGRGVGLDVVKKNVESLRGSVDITTEEGKGTCFSLRLPLTLAITDGMLIQAGEERYIVPTVNIQLSVKPDPADISTITGRGEMYNSRDGLIPVLRLHNLFAIEDAVTEIEEGLLLIINDNERKFGLFVDGLLGQQQVVIKTLGDGIDRIDGISGGAILGDGKVGLILDPQGLWEFLKQFQYQVEEYAV